MGPPGPVEGLADRRALVRAEVVHDHERVGPPAPRRDQDLLGEGQEDGLPVAAATPRLATIPSSASAPSTVSRSTVHGYLPTARRPGGAGQGARHAGVDAGLVDEHEAGRVDPGRLGAPRPPRLGDILTVPLGGLDAPFLADEAQHLQRPARPRGCADARCAPPAGPRPRQGRVVPLRHQGGQRLAASPPTGFVPHSAASARSAPPRGGSGSRERPLAIR